MSWGNMFSALGLAADGGDDPAAADWHVAGSGRNNTKAAAKAAARPAGGRPGSAARGRPAPKPAESAAGESTPAPAPDSAITDSEISDSAATDAGAEPESRNRHVTKGPSGLFMPLVWIDLEMTGLDLATDHILEIAVIVTDGRLASATEGPNLAIKLEDSVLDSGMNPWSAAQHGKSGLTARCRAEGVILADAESRVLEFVSRHVHPGQGLIAGNTVHCDLAFLRKDMPRLAAHLHYRIVDVSSVRELAKRWFPREASGAPRKAGSHTALADIRESIAELRYLRRAVFK